MSIDDIENEKDQSKDNKSIESTPKRKTAHDKEKGNDDFVNQDRMQFAPDDEAVVSSDEKATSSDFSDKQEKAKEPNQSDKQNRSSGKNNKNNRFKRTQNSNNKRGGKKTNKSRQVRRFKNNSSEYELIQLDGYLETDLFQSFESINGIYSALDLSDTNYNYDSMYEKDLNQLREELVNQSIDLSGHNTRNSIIQCLFDKAFEEKKCITTIGVLDIPEEGLGGFLVYEIDNYRIKILNSYVPQKLIDHYGLKRGHIIEAVLHKRIENTNCSFVVKINSVMGDSPEKVSECESFTELVPYYPLDRIILESDIVPDKENLPMRVVDCLTPIGFGQRGLIVAPPRTGKTVLMQGIANSIQLSYPEAHLIILLIDERPEEVTDFKRKVKGEVISSTFDESADSHVHAAEVVIEKARRMVEVGKDVIILLDSITRLARAYNTSMPSSGKILSGGVEANALQLPKRFFGSARNIEDGGSLTIIATALVETGSKMDEVIFEEFKGTGNMDLHRDRALSEKRIFPSLSMDKSGTRKEELIYHPDEIQKIYSLRRAMKGIPSEDAMEMLIQRIKKTSTNVEFLMSVAR